MVIACIIIIKYNFCSIITFPMDKKININEYTCIIMLIQTINFAHTQKLIIIITMSLFLHDCVCCHHYDSVLIQFRSRLPPPQQISASHRAPQTRDREGGQCD